MPAFRYIFGYGSLVNEDKLRRFFEENGLNFYAYHLCALKGYRRVWNIAMDNSVDIPGYKYYRERASRRRPDFFVAFLNIEPHPTLSVNGCLFQVDETGLDILKRRERNYVLNDVSTSIDPPCDLPVSAFIGREDGRERYERGIALNRICVQKDYLDSVHRAFERLGTAEYEAFLRSTRLPSAPVKELECLAVEH